MMRQVPAVLDVGLGAGILALGAIPILNYVARPLPGVAPGRGLARAVPASPRSGIGVFVSVLVLLPLFGPEPASPALPVAMLLAGAVLVLGLADDRFDLPYPARLLAQFGIGATAGLLGFRPEALPLEIGVLLAAATLMAGTVILERMDTVRGLAAGVAAIAAATLAAAFDSIGLAAWRDLNAAVCGALVASLIHGLSRHEPRACLGHCGSMSCGALLGLSAMTLAEALPPANAHVGAAVAEFLAWRFLGA